MREEREREMLHKGMTSKQEKESLVRKGREGKAREGKAIEKGRGRVTGGKVLGRQRKG